MSTHLPQYHRVLTVGGSTKEWALVTEFWGRILDSRGTAESSKQGSLRVPVAQQKCLHKDVYLRERVQRHVQTPNFEVYVGKTLLSEIRYNFHLEHPSIAD